MSILVNIVVAQILILEIIGNVTIAEDMPPNPSIQNHIVAKVAKEKPLMVGGVVGLVIRCFTIIMMQNMVVVAKTKDISMKEWVTTVDATKMQKTVQNTVAWGQNHFPQGI
jgi:hypothetical protein